MTGLETLICVGALHFAKLPSLPSQMGVKTPFVREEPAVVEKETHDLFFNVTLRDPHVAGSSLDELQSLTLPSKAVSGYKIVNQAFIQGKTSSWVTKTYADSPYSPKRVGVSLRIFATQAEAQNYFLSQYDPKNVQLANVTSHRLRGTELPFDSRLGDDCFYDSPPLPPSVTFRLGRVVASAYSTNSEIRIESIARALEFRILRNSDLISRPNIARTVGFRGRSILSTTLDDTKYVRAQDLKKFGIDVSYFSAERFPTIRLSYKGSMFLICPYASNSSSKNIGPVFTFDGDAIVPLRTVLKAFGIKLG